MHILITGRSCASRPLTSGRSVLRCVSFYFGITLTAALTLAPQLFKHQEEYFDIPTQDLSIRAIRARLAQLAGSVLPAGAAAADQVTQLLTLAGSPNGGTAVTDDLKYNGASSSRAFIDSHILISYILSSQIRPPERDPRLPDRPLGRPRPEPGQQRLGGGRVDGLLREAGHCVDRPLHRIQHK